MHRSLTPEDIKKGIFIWMAGSTMTNKWSCPAVVIEVDEANQRFLIKDLQDMCVTDYPLPLDQHSSPCRHSMRLITAEEAKRYVDGRMLELKQRCERKERELKQALATVHSKSDAYKQEAAQIAFV